MSSYCCILCSIWDPCIKAQRTTSAVLTNVYKERAAERDCVPLCCTRVVSSFLCCSSDSSTALVSRSASWWSVLHCYRHTVAKFCYSQAPNGLTGPVSNSLLSNALLGFMWRSDHHRLVHIEEENREPSTCCRPSACRLVSVPAAFRIVFLSRTSAVFKIQETVKNILNILQSVL